MKRVVGGAGVENEKNKNGNNARNEETFSTTSFNSGSVRPLSLALAFCGSDA